MVLLLPLWAINKHRDILTVESQFLYMIRNGHGINLYGVRVILMGN